MSSHSSFGSGSAKSKKTVTMSKSKFAPKKEAEKMADKDIPVEIITQVDIKQEEGIATVVKDIEESLEGGP